MSLRLRPLVKEDLPTLERWWEEPEASYLDGGDTAGPSVEFRQAFEKSLEQLPSDTWSIIELEAGEPAGYILYRIYPEDPVSAEVAVRLSCAYWGRGIASEALQLILAKLFQEKGFERTWLTVFVFNQRAIRLYQRIGFEVLESFTDDRGLELFRMELNRTTWSGMNRSPLRE